MQIKNFKIENFKGIEKFEYPDVKRCTAFIGSNGRGKTSILDAFRAVITGSAPDVPVRTGSSAAIISADICGYNVERKYSAKNSVKLNGKTTTQKSIDELLCEETDSTLDTMDIATSSKVLAAMTAGELSDYLVNNGLIPAEINIEDLISLCSMSSDAEVEIRKHFPLAPDKFNLDFIENVYNIIFGERKVLKQNAVALKAQILPHNNKPLRKEKDVQKDMHKFIVYKNELATYNTLMDSYNRTLNKRNASLKRLAEIEDKIKNAPKFTVDENELKQLENQKRNVQKEILNLKQTVATLRSNISIFARTLDNLNGTVCPISNRLVCTTDKTAAREEITELLNNNRAELEKANNHIESLENTIKTLDNKINEYYSRAKAYSDLVNLYNSRKAIKDNIPELPDLPKKPDEINNSEEEQLALEKELDEIKKRNDSVIAQKKLDMTEKRISLLNELITILSPKSGIREKIIEVALIPLIDHCNRRASELKLNFTVGMKVEKGVRIICNPNTSLYTESIPVSSVSSGEQAYVLFLVMDALNSLTNLGLLVLDDLDKLDVSALDRFFNLLSKPGVLDGYNHILIAMVNHKNSVEVLNKYKGTVVDEIIDVNLL